MYLQEPLGIQRAPHDADAVFIRVIQLANSTDVFGCGLSGTSLSIVFSAPPTWGRDLIRKNGLSFCTTTVYSFRSPSRALISEEGA